ncbi:hypothetical protein [Delftia sp. RIT313]|uniref:hypothetical protein n=1 Tax=Delftia sp. RIT313 TaxID=1468410 RepID=UPI0012678DCE|nr:hypothetical protein [Delftia sp. RIT313]
MPTLAASDAQQSKALETVWQHKHRSQTSTRTHHTVSPKVLHGHDIQFLIQKKMTSASSKTMSMQFDVRMNMTRESSKK